MITSTLPPSVLPGSTRHVGVPGVRGRATPGTLEVLLGSPGRCPEVPTHTLILCDNSGSVTGGIVGWALGLPGFLDLGLSVAGASGLIWYFRRRSGGPAP